MSKVSSQLLLEYWDILANYYFVIKAEVAALKNDNVPEYEIFSYMSNPGRVMHDFYECGLAAVKDKIIAHFI
jgi:hypothetical protein